MCSPTLPAAQGYGTRESSFSSANGTEQAQADWPFGMGDLPPGSVRHDDSDGFPPCGPPFRSTSRNTMDIREVERWYSHPQFGAGSFCSDQVGEKYILFGVAPLDVWPTTDGVVPPFVWCGTAEVVIPGGIMPYIDRGDAESCAPFARVGPVREWSRKASYARGPWEREKPWQWWTFEWADVDGDGLPDVQDRRRCCGGGSTLEIEIRFHSTRGWVLVRRMVYEGSCGDPLDDVDEVDMEDGGSEPPIADVDDVG